MLYILYNIYIYFGAIFSSHKVFMRELSELSSLYFSFCEEDLFLLVMGDVHDDHISIFHGIILFSYFFLFGFFVNFFLIFFA